MVATLVRWNLPARVEVSFAGGCEQSAPSDACGLFRSTQNAPPLRQSEMSLRVEFAAWWDADVNLRTARYAEKAGIEIAERFVQAVETTIRLLADNPHLGRRPFPN